MMTIRTMLIMLLAGCIGCANAMQPDSNYTLYLVRHAEKQTDQGKDPDLTEAGRIRSEKLANWLQDKNIGKIWSTDYKRTRNTALPLVTRLGLGLTIYDPRDLQALSNEVLLEQTNAVIVGHSNTTPELTRLLCQCEINDMDESEYDLLFVVSKTKNETTVETLKQASLLTD